MNDDAKEAIREGDPAKSSATTIPVVAVKCVRCEYDLRGSAPDGRCPECGLAVELSAAREKLALLEPVWLQYLSAGARWVLAAKIGLGIALTVALVLAVITGKSVMPFLLQEFGALTLVLVIGAWCFTRPPSLHIMSNRLMWSGRIAYWMAAIVMVGPPAAYIAWRMNAAPLVILSVHAIGSPFGFAGAIGGAAFGIYCRGLAKMFMDEAIAVQTRRNLVLYLIGCCLSGPFWFIALVSSPFPGSSIFDLGPLAQIYGGGYLLLLPSALSRHVQSLRVEAEEKLRGFEPDHSD